MPEGDTVYRAAGKLDRALSGHELVRTDFRVPQLATTDLAGATVTETISRGKHLLTRIAAGTDRWTLHTHLKMEGSWRIYAADERWRRPAHQARVVLATIERQAVGFSLGIVELLPTADEDSVVGHLGPDLLGPDWDEAEALRRLLDDPSRTVAQALLDQGSIAGIGNMYRSEILFLAGVSPYMAARQVGDLAKVVGIARKVMIANRDSASPRQSTTGSTRRGEEYWVYRRKGEPCRRCGSPILRAMLGQPERSVYWCPHCQPDGHQGRSQGLPS